MDAELALMCSFSGLAIGFAAILINVFTGVSLITRITSLERRLSSLQRQLDAKPDAAASTTEVLSTASEAASLAEPISTVLAEPDTTSAAAAAEVDRINEPVPPVSRTPAAPPSSVRPAPVGPQRQPWSIERLVVYGAVLMGGFMLIIGALFALVTVASYGWIGPGVRIALALVAGTASWVTGAVLRGRLRVFPAALEGVGMSLMLGGIFAAHSIYGILGPLLTFALYVSISVVAGVRAAAHDDRVMAYLGLIGGLLAPVLVSSGNNGAVGLFSYLFLLACGALLVASKRRWPDLVAATALGMAALYFGWTTRWYVAESVWMAHFGALLLSVPFAVAAARTDGDDTAAQVTRFVAGVGSVCWTLLLLPWLLPVDAEFVDPRSGLTVIRPGAFLAELAAFTPALLPLPLALAARWRRDVVLGSIAVGAGVLPAFTATFAWSFIEYLRLDGMITGGFDRLGPLDVVVVGTVLPVLLLSIVFAGARRTGAALPLTLLPAAITSIGLASIADGPRWAAVVVSLTVISCIAATTSTAGFMLFALVCLQALALTTAAMQIETLGVAWVLGPPLFVLGLVPLTALSQRWHTDRIPGFAWAGGLLAIPAVFPALYRCWDHVLGSSFIGVLPVLLGVVALLATAVLLRYHRVERSAPMLGFAILLTVAGVSFAIPLQLESQWLTVGWALEALAIAAIAKRMPQPMLRATAVFLGITVAVRLLLNPWSLSYGDAGGWPILNWTLYTWGVPTLCLLGIAALLGKSTVSRASATLLRILAMFTGFALINVEVSHAFQDAGPLELGGHTVLQGMVRSISWGTYGLGLLGIGLGASSRHTRLFGFAFILLAASKVLIYDLWTLPGFIRAGSLIGLGVILLIAALLFERLVLRGTSPIPDDVES